MDWQFWRWNGAPKALPANVQDAVKTKLKISQEDINRLRLVEKSGEYSGRKVRTIRAFDTRLVNGTPVDQIRYNTLNNMKHALVFEGHIERDGAMVINDRRVAKAPAGGAR